MTFNGLTFFCSLFLLAANLVHTNAQIRNRTTTTGTAIAGIRVAHFESALGALVGSTGTSFTTYGLKVI